MMLLMVRMMLITIIMIIITMLDDYGYDICLLIEKNLLIVWIPKPDLRSSISSR